MSLEISQVVERKCPLSFLLFVCSIIFCFELLGVNLFTDTDIVLGVYEAGKS
jgi:hypothetical protein